ncbi:hypothetical protein [Luteimonas marina]|uniref:hypothetical protein n=1 Tax=Luteimonas marina TaxID=488485 RepID=UPI0013155C9D|nr:hypothetical protein [Luteimonas marina]
MIRRLPVWAWMSACAATGLALGVAWPPPPIPKARGAEGEWTLPDARTLARFSADNYKQATGSVQWGDNAAEGAQSQAWRLAGFLLTSPDSTALIETVGTRGVKAKVVHAKPGDALPDGARLLAINGDKITSELDGCKSVRQLYRKLPISRSGECDATAAPPENQEKSTK